MPGRTECQTLLDTDDFDGTTGQGLFDFSSLDAYPITTRVQINAVSYATVAGASGDLSIYVEQPGGLSTSRMLIARALEADMLGPTGFGNDFRSCPFILPRLADGRFWQLLVFTTNKQVTGTVCTDWLLAPHPDVCPDDGPSL